MYEGSSWWSTGSVLGPILSLHAPPRKYYSETWYDFFFDWYDNTQLYLSTKNEETEPLARLQACLKHITDQITFNFLILNSRQDKSEVIVVRPKQLRTGLSDSILSSDGIILSTSMTVRNLVVIFNQDMSFLYHIKQVSGTIFFYLCNTDPDLQDY